MVDFSRKLHFFNAKIRIILGISKPPICPHGLILSENEAIPSVMLLILLLGADLGC